MIPQRQNPAEQKNRDRVEWVKAFEECLFTMAGMYNKRCTAPGSKVEGFGFIHPVKKVYMDACEGWSIQKMRAVFRKAMESEEFCPTVAKLLAYGAGVRDEDAGPIVQPSRRIVYTPEERADIDRMKAELRAKGLSMPWAKELPASPFMGRGYGT